MKLKNPITQLENSWESFASTMDHTEGRISGFEDKVEELGHIKKEFEKI